MESLRSLTQAGGSLEPAFGLSGAVRPLDKVLPPLVRVFALSGLDSMSCLLGLAGLDRPPTFLPIGSS